MVAFISAFIAWASRLAHSSPQSTSHAKDVHGKGRAQPRRLKSHDTESRLSSANLAWKRAQIKKNLQKPLRGHRELDAFVYVGNIDATVTERILHAKFAPCGQIHRVQVRCSPGGIYASVEFFNSFAVGKALSLNGDYIGEHKIIVCLTPGELPLLKVMLDARLAQIRTSRGGQSPRNHGRPLTWQPTEIVPRVIPESVPSSSGKPAPGPTTNNRVWGFSFGKCVA